ncbi:hypothetical protein [Sulfurovum mangrovi]|uniref:hypothetical protein n=1 Tax=Sulfurovum mangrovi TaxID=2893889 RepID=UPI001E2C3729|nr:hypothetical protein [Sulfurovum mangrovi]UFH58333.1 hypothetical protein LN246_08220 [Sulfurovum mangrovi]
MQTKKHPKVVLLKGNGPITVNSEMMELITITLSHGLIGLPLKSLRAQRVYIVKDMERFWDVHKEIKEKPCCFLYSYEKLEEEDLNLIKAEDISFI